MQGSSDEQKLGRTVPETQHVQDVYQRVWVKALFDLPHT